MGQKTTLLGSDPLSEKSTLGFRVFGTNKEITHKPNHFDGPNGSQALRRKAVSRKTPIPIPSKAHVEGSGTASGPSPIRLLLRSYVTC